MEIFGFILRVCENSMSPFAADLQIGRISRNLKKKCAFFMWPKFARWEN